MDKTQGVSSQYIFFKDERESKNRLTRYEPKLLQAFAGIRKNRPFFNRIMRSDMKFTFKDKWEINLDFNTATLVDSKDG